MPLPFLFAVLFSSSPEQLMAARQYLDATRSLRERISLAGREEDVWTYTHLLIDQHIVQVGFRSFSMRNLASTDSVDALRAEAAAQPDHKTKVQELNLEALLLEWRAKKPDSFAISLAAAYYVHFGREKTINPLLKMNENEVLALFREALRRGMVTALMMVELALMEKKNSGGWNHEQEEILREAQNLEPKRRAVLTTRLECLLDLKQYRTIPDLARALFENSLVLEDRLFALHSSLLAYQAMKEHEKARSMVRAGLRLLPRHLLLWRTGLASALAKGSGDTLAAYCRLWCEGNLWEPGSFQEMLACLDETKDHPGMRLFIEGYAAQTIDHQFFNLIRLVNLASYHSWQGHKEQALDYLEKAELLARTLNETGLLVQILQARQGLEQRSP
jgi:tetratricopeptide (TPR) repeat protein